MCKWRTLRYVAALALVFGAEVAARDTVLGLGISQAPRTLDPRFATDAVSERLVRLLYRRLVEFDAHDRPVPGLATWEQLTPTAYRFCLGATGREFVDGSRLTAADVVATYQSVLDPTTASPHRAPLTLIASLAARDEDCVEFTLNAPDALFPAYLGLGILPAAALARGHDFAHTPLGSGPFRCVAWPAPGRVELERRRDGQRFAVVTVSDPNVRAMKLLRGEIDLVQNDLPPELVGWLRRQRGVRVITQPGRNVFYLGFNLTDPVTGRWEVRQALAHALDRSSILRHLFQGLAREAHTVLPATHWAAASTLQTPGYDPARARALLAALGHDAAHPLPLQYKTSSDPFRLRIATVMQAQLAEVGISLTIRSYDWGTFFGDVKAGRFQLYGLTWVGVRTPDIFRHAFHSASVPPQGANRGRYRSVTVDRLIEQARAAPDLGVQAVLYRAVQTELLRDLPYLPLWAEDQVAALREGVEGYRPAADGSFDGLLDTYRR